MEKSSFFNSIKQGDTWDRLYFAEDFASYFSSFIGNGVFPNPSTGLQVISIDNNYCIRVKSGKAWINGYYYQNTDDFNLNLDIADGILDRIDRIVLSLNFNTRSINLKVKKGTFASSPIAPSLQRDSDIFELALADIKITHGSIGINQANITDLRLNKELCGIVCAVIQNVDTTSIFNQYETWFKNCENQYKQWFGIFTDKSSDDFNTWFTKIKNILGSDEASAIFSKLLELKETYLKSVKDIELIKQQQLEFLTQKDLENKSSKLDCGYFFDTLKDNSKIEKDFYARRDNKGFLTDGKLTDYCVWKEHNIGFETNKVTYYHKRNKIRIRPISSINSEKNKINITSTKIIMEVV